jgi:hypothetical protein
MISPFRNSMLDTVSQQESFAQGVRFLILYGSERVTIELFYGQITVVPHQRISDATENWRRYGRDESKREAGTGDDKHTQAVHRIMGNWSQLTFTEWEATQGGT